MADNTPGRRPHSGPAPTGGRPRFTQRPQHHISTTSTKTAYPNGEINVKNFLRSHENEIKSLESAMKAAKKGLMRRAFQDVPRELRRRTASHNPQRVPRRLRPRARQDAWEDNTPISKGKSGSGIGKGKKKWLRKEGIEKSRARWEARAKRRKEKSISDAAAELPKQETGTKRKRSESAVLAAPPTPASRFRRRQRDKTWLPTHLWHTKRSRMTNPKEPLWRFAIPLAPAVKSYRLTHRAASLRGAVAWDTSYIATIGLEGSEANIIGVLKGLNFAVESPEDVWKQRNMAKKWMNGTRAWEGWIYKREGKAPDKIAPVTIIWSVPGSSVDDRRQALIRVHPSAFLQLWEELARVAKMQKPAVTIQDLRFQIGSIEIIGPAAAETLCSVLSPIAADDQSSDTPEAIWSRLAQVTDPCSLPWNALSAFSICDPRLRDPPKTSTLPQDITSQNHLMELLASWPIDTTLLPSALFSSTARLAAERSLQSQKSINRRKSACTLGNYPEPRSTDPQIPTLIFVSRTTKSWTVLLPWNCVLPVWRAVMRYPISTGGNPRFGGLKERHQVDFERSVPSFPYDFPGTNAGWGWELLQRTARKLEWTKRPKGKRIEWSTIDLGNDRKGEIGDPWACDWLRLLSPSDRHGANNTNTPFQQVSTKHAADVVARSPAPTQQVHLSLFTVKISMVERGTPTSCARVYRLPTADLELRSKWLSLLPHIRSKSASKLAIKKERTTSGDARIDLHRKLADGLLNPQELNGGPPKAGAPGYPIVPDEQDLIGFVTTGNYNLAEGVPTAIANLALHRVWQDKTTGEGMTEDDRLCIVREAGRTIGRLARWEVV